MNESQAMPINLIAPSSEHAPKRWYQLSMLQMLVAATIVATFLTTNRSIRKDRIVTVTDGRGIEYDIQAHVAGWPFQYWHQTSMLKEVTFDSIALFGNVVSWGIVLFGALWLSAMIPPYVHFRGNHDRT